jgi:hypothetical protein
MSKLKSFRYRGLKVSIYSKSFAVAGYIVFTGKLPTEDEIKKLIDVCQVERFAGYDDKQIYYSWRHYPRAMFLTAFLFFMLGVVFSGLFFWLTL